MGAVYLLCGRVRLLHRGAGGLGPSCALPLCFCYLVTIITYYLGYCKQKSDNFCWCRCEETSLRRRFCALRAVGSLVSTVQIRSYVHPLCDIWAAPHGRIFLLRSYPHKPNRARRAQSAHAPNAALCRTEAVGTGRRNMLPVAEGHYAASRTPRNACL